MVTIWQIDLKFFIILCNYAIIQFIKIVKNQKRNKNGKNFRSCIMVYCMLPQPYFVIIFVIVVCLWNSVPRGPMSSEYSVAILLLGAYNNEVVGGGRGGGGSCCKHI